MTDGPCEHCPCPSYCLRWEVWCAEWAPSGDPVKLAHIRTRSGAPRPMRGDVAGPAIVPAIDATMARLSAIRGCPYRSTEGCGCSGARCALRGGEAVSHLDCLPCLERYGP